MRTYGWRALALVLAALLAAAAAAFLAARPAARAASESVPEGQLLIRSETAGEALSLYTGTWRLLERMRLDGSGAALIDTAGEGRYHLVRGGGQLLEFTLDSAGRADVTAGCGFGSGRTLTLTETVRGSIRVCCRAERPLACRLEGDAGTQYGTIPAMDGTGLLPGFQFVGLAPGVYRLSVDGGWTTTVAVTEDAPRRTVTLD